MSTDRWYTANQPLYFPAMYMIERFARVQEVIVMMEAQFSKFGHQSRIEINTKQGKHKLILPLKDRSFKRLNEVEVHEPERWLKQLEGTLRAVYGKYPAFKQYGLPMLSGLRNVLAYSGGAPLTQADIGWWIMEWTWAVLRLPAKLSRSQQWVKVRPDDANDWIIDLGRAVNCNVYLGGRVAAEEYMDEAKWSAAGIRVMLQDWKMPPYEAEKGVMETNGTISFIDCLFRHGPEHVRTLVEA